ncbi:TBC1 domain family member 19 isoform X1 [Tachypleus tridentatus]|uniref:TBC1 domain family member 19 isoform X1 n=1 Tax=Tachypleus tridentatus TaxID=6853 RepID=UPI003FD0462C
MCNELGIALSRKRPVSEQKDMEAKWTELGSEEMDLSRFRPVYSPKDFLDVLVSLRNPNLSNSEQGAATLWGDIKIPLKVNNLQNLRSEFEELTSNISQVEVDNYSSFDTEHCVTFLHERSVLGKKVLQTNHSPLSREYAKRGCLQSQRANLWCQILGISIHNEDRLKFEHLKSCVFRHDLMIDKLIFKDIRLTAANDDQYFVFEDLLYQILLVFSRDVSIVEHFRYSSATPPKGFLRGRSGQEEGLVVYPPSGIIPYHGFTMYVTPLCYLYDDPVTLYGVFKELFCRYLCCLHTVSSHPQGILCLCLQFEMLLHEADPQLMYHCAHHDIHPFRLKIAQKWIMRMFAGYLSVDQVLLLWDRILAYDSLEILPVLAVAIMSFRKSILLTAENQATLEAMLADVSTIKVVPLLQWLLTRSV